ncbi:hypothetical protein BU26DRAFT_215195 [Trematosphaeria pertusa]|uniref:Uncharacterized protein n=1 Tax=Trematosphaeria pertusa TaxID=390896 RepID=A0A6A6IS72_9PLEO|nr:uncharacterized protein BU26DRAFT_215195 [Trematosphaeria pertusa]KAF2253109.1 hypothetical protein BU26DRAFT_215195 [Trematosphaeria pertusa]
MVEIQRCAAGVMRLSTKVFLSSQNQDHRTPNAFTSSRREHSDDSLRYPRMASCILRGLDMDPARRHHFSSTALSPEPPVCIPVLVRGSNRGPSTRLLSPPSSLAGGRKGRRICQLSGRGSYGPKGARRHGAGLELRLDLPGSISVEGLCAVPVRSGAIRPRDQWRHRMMHYVFQSISKRHYPPNGSETR